MTRSDPPTHPVGEALHRGGACPRQASTDARPDQSLPPGPTSSVHMVTIQFDPALFHPRPDLPDNRYRVGKDASRPGAEISVSRGLYPPRKLLLTLAVEQDHSRRKYRR